MINDKLTQPPDNKLMTWKIPARISKTIDTIILYGALVLAIIGGLYFFVEEHYLRGHASSAVAGRVDEQMIALHRDLVQRLPRLPQLADTVPTPAPTISPAGASVIWLMRNGRPAGLAVTYAGRSADGVISFSDQHHSPIDTHAIGDGASMALLPQGTQRVRVHVDGTFVEKIGLPTHSSN